MIIATLITGVLFTGGCASSPSQSNAAISTTSTMYVPATFTIVNGLEKVTLRTTFNGKEVKIASLRETQFPAGSSPVTLFFHVIDDEDGALLGFLVETYPAAPRGAKGNQKVVVIDDPGKITKGVPVP